MTTKITNSFPVLQAEAERYHSTRSSKERDIVEVWNHAVAKEADRACLTSICGIISTPVSSVILSSQALYNALSIYGGPLAKFMSPVCFDVSLVLVMGTPMIASLTTNAIGLSRLFRALSATIAEKKIEDHASLRLLPRNPRVRKQAIQIIGKVGQDGERLASLKYKSSTYIGQFLDKLRL